MILAAGLTPAWQQILCFDRVQLGEVNRACEAVWCASGKVANVGLALHHLGASSRMLCAVGGDSGRAIKSEFAVLRADVEWIETAAATRVCTTLIDRSSGTITELVENSRLLVEAELQQFHDAFAGQAGQANVLVLTGSLPAETPAGFYRDLLRESSGRAVLDVRGPELLEALVAKPFLVKPNREELSRTVGKELNSDADLVAAMQELNARGAEWVVITQGRQAVWATSAGRAWRFMPPDCNVVNPIGCGDCVAAGIAWGLDRRQDPLAAIQLGIAAAADNLWQLLPARLDPVRVEHLAKKVAAQES